MTKNRNTYSYGKKNIIAFKPGPYLHILMHAYNPKCDTKNEAMRNV